LLLDTASKDGKPVKIGFGQEPRQAGKTQALYLVRALSGFTVRPAAESGDKLTRFGPFSSQCRAGNVKILRGPGNEDLFRVLEGFPDLAHDDEVDACSGALEMLNPQMKGYGVFEFYRRQAEQLQARSEPTSGRPEPTRAPGSMEWLAEQKKSD
jgi:predicted phage terminase large subunit-like protein